MKKLILIINIFLFYYYFNHNLSSFNEPKNLAIGDLVLRVGIGMDSSLIQLASKQKYTHIGIISSINPNYVIHSTYDDLGFSGVVEFSLADFLKGSKEVLIIRLDDLTIAKKIKLIEKLKTKMNYKFILNESDEALYCSTFIYNDLKDFLSQKLNKTYLNLPINKGYYLLPDEFLKLKHKIIFKEKDYLKIL